MKKRDILKEIKGLSSEEKRIKTYIRGFDETIGGGIPKGHIVLFAGSAGTMKSSLCYHILYHNAINEGIRGLYVSLEQGKSSLEAQMRGLGYDISKVRDLVHIWDLGLIRSSLITGETWMSLFKKDVLEFKKKVRADLFVLDSLPVLEIIAKFSNPREEIFYFFDWLRDLGVTAFLISEMKEGDSAYSRNDEDFLSDGIVHLKMHALDDIHVQRRIRCVKMRHTKHSMDFWTLLIDRATFSATRVIAED